MVQIVRIPMRTKMVLALAVALAAAVASTAGAATRKTTTVAQVGPTQRTVYTYTDDNGRRRTKIIVQKRSYLDAGTTVLPGQRKYNDYATQPYRDPFDALGPGRGAFERNPIGPRWEFGGANY
jgi:hypothetical protein